MIVCTLLLLAAMYLTYFYMTGGSFTKGDLGTLGDFIGGNINPILTFISTVLLIEAAAMQRTAAENAKSSEMKARATIRQQSALAIKQSFESSLFNLINLCIGEYKNTTIDLKSGTYSGNRAFSKYLELYDSLIAGGSALDALVKLEEISSDALFDNIKNFSATFKFIEESAPKSEKENYISLILTIMPTAFVQLMCIAMVHSSWPIMGNFQKSGIFEKPAVKQLIDHYSKK